MKNRSTALTFVPLVTVWAVFGSTYIAVAISAETMPALMSTGDRFGAAGILILLYLLVIGRASSFKISFKQGITASLTGVAMMGFKTGAIALAVGVGSVPTSLVAISEALMPVWVIIFRLSHREQFKKKVIVGVFLGLAGVIVAIVGGSFSETEGLSLSTILWLIVIQIGSVVWAYLTWKAPRLNLPKDTLVATVFQLIAAAISLNIIGWFIGERWNLAGVSTVSWWAWVYLAVASVFAYISYTWLMTNSSASLTSSFSYTSPVIGTALGFALAGEQVSAATLLGLIAAVIGVVLITRGETQGRIRNA